MNNAIIEQHYLTHQGNRDTFFEDIPQEVKEFWTNIGKPIDTGSLLPILYYIGSLEKWKYVLEIGTGYAHSTSALAAVVEQQGGMLVTLDIYNHYPKVKRLPATIQDSISFHLVNSKDYAHVKRILDSHGAEKLDALFIDGDHLVESVKQDFELYKGLVRKGGFVLFHDVCIIDNECEVPYMWYDLDDPEFEKLTLSGSNGLGIMRKK
jgi:predicted O-methyltransferase YrrM